MTVDRGNWMQTFTGARFYPLSPRADEVDPRDIAHALALICRYGGHSTHFYSVAEHCVLLSHAVSPENALWALLHDATEAYVGDMVRPLKRMLPAYRDIEDRVMDAIAERFGLTGSIPAEVHDADNRIILTERAAIMTPTDEVWMENCFKPLPVTIHAWPWQDAQHYYTERLAELT